MLIAADTNVLLDLAVEVEAVVDADATIRHAARDRAEVLPLNRLTRESVSFPACHRHAGASPAARNWTVHERIAVAVMLIARSRYKQATDEQAGRNANEPPRRRRGIVGVGGRASHRQLMQDVTRRLSDGAILALIKAWLRAPILDEDAAGKRRVTPNRQGTPPFGFAQILRQGGVICQRPPALPFGLPAAGYLAPLGSPLLANIYLNPLDHQINESHQRRHRLIRYADDFVVLSPAGQSAPIRQEIESWLESRGLELHATKARTVNVTQQASAFWGSR